MKLYLTILLVTFLGWLSHMPLLKEEESDLQWSRIKRSRIESPGIVKYIIRDLFLPNIYFHLKFSVKRFTGVARTNTNDEVR